MSVGRLSYSASAFCLVKIRTWDRYTIVATDPFVDKIVGLLKQDGTWSKMVDTVINKYKDELEKSTDRAQQTTAINSILWEITDAFNSMTQIYTTNC